MEASRSTPIHLHLEVRTGEELSRLLEALKGGRFIIQIRVETKTELAKLLSIARRYG